MGATITLDGGRQTKRKWNQTVPQTMWKCFPKQKILSSTGRALCSEGHDQGHVFYQFNVIPPGVVTTGLDPAQIIWWTDCMFMPFDDSQIITSLGGYFYRGSQGLTQLRKMRLQNYFRIPQGFMTLWRFNDPHYPEVLNTKPSRALPHCSVSTNGTLVSFFTDTDIMCSSLCQNSLVKAKETFCSTFFFSAFSGDSNYVAVLARSRLHLNLAVVVIILRASDMLVMYQRCVRELFQHFKLQKHLINQDRLECRFSPDSQFVAISTTAGQLFLIKRDLSKLECVLVDGKDEELTNERCYDFDPRFPHEVLAFCVNSDQVYVKNIESGSQILHCKLPENVMKATCLKYNMEGDSFAVGCQDGVIVMMSSSTGNILYLLDSKTQAAAFAMTPCKLSMYPEIIRISFSHSDDVLAVSSTEGTVRLWQLPPKMNLVHMCRLVILKHIPASTIKQLPLPTMIADLIVCCPRERARITPVVINNETTQV
ncbi:uncharacterized protein LOC117121018 [Anneissia japonica]|uniref:uncharacterized protein LOC117121018 n=1 Tax=Anneissia japonica TaxID=1529436 RepID=UPI0014257955|nr:uncharacterized protein LOC117121018 [Anneissia japonica]XP_033122003.1 uncharacterized protein LOC117121018 [Anneissia japonica]XP_033122004.1 uncharacterized protein LOC117121018 [Anneissia japonica]XP_033122005.1 uncharacterized protein LOC117121018 [Anneissia japonica]